MMQYINTLANDGIKLKPYIVKYIKNDNNEIIFENKTTELDKVNSLPIYINRTKQGLQSVLEPGGTGYNYINSIYKPAGKTGTSQSFIDTDLDGKIDTGTISTAFVGYAPYDNPKITFTIITPDVSIINNNNYISTITKRSTFDISNTYFNIAK
jgi:cell division protein FtsI/penicillin-binding protein 2